MNQQYNPETAKKPKLRLPMRAYLSYLLIATLLFTGISFSKFASSGNADDDARVAVGELETHVAYVPDLSISETHLVGSYGFCVTNLSEVALTYSIVVTLPEALPEGMMIYFKLNEVNPGGRTITGLEWPDTVLDDDLIMLPIVSEDRKVCTFKNIGTFEAETYGETDHFCDWCDVCNSSYEDHNLYFSMGSYSGKMRVWIDDEHAGDYTGYRDSYNGEGYYDVDYKPSWDGTEDDEYADGPLNLNDIKISVVAEQID